MPTKLGPGGYPIPDRESYGTERVTLEPQLDDAIQLHVGRIPKKIAAHILGFKFSNIKQHKPDTIAESDDNRGLGKTFKPKGRK